MAEALLVELLTEELPPRSLGRLGESFRESMQKSLAEAGYIESANAGRSYATPRRLAVQFDAVAAVQPDRTVERKGPAVASGVGVDGAPTKALEGFMRSAGVHFEQLERMHDGKAEYFVARLHKAGEPLEAHLATFVDAALKKLPVAKLMRWGAGEAQFVRPVHGLVMLHGARVVPGSVLGLSSGDVTRGHRFLGASTLTLANARDYDTTLREQGRVIAAFAQRRAEIERQLLAYCTQHGLSLPPDYRELLDEVAALVEWPVVYAARFEEVFLEVPPECLILTMQRNQKYFPLFDAQGRLQSRFLVVSNMAVADPRHIIDGNQRVVRPRLSDARFFYDQDRRQPLAARVERLGQIVYHNQLGSQLARVERLERLAGAIATRLGGERGAAGRAARLAKADLVTDMVGEFPELQGVMGRYYALHDGESATVADAIEQHYRPRFAGDALPAGNVACAVALADKLDALVGFFGIGQLPTGDKDPFGLRRAALGVLRMLAELQLPLDVRELLDEAAAAFPAGVIAAGAVAQLHDFLLERLRHWLREAGHAPDAVDAVLELKPTRFDRVMARVEAVRQFAGLPEAAALASANKRIGNILRKAEAAGAEPDVLLLQERAERALFDAVREAAPLVRAHFANDDYAQALCLLARLRAPVDTFFDEVLVMAEEPLTRRNRLALLAQLGGLMNQVADISKLAIAR